MLTGLMMLAVLAAGPAESISAPAEKLVIDTSGLANPDRTQKLLREFGASRLQNEQMQIDRSQLQEALQRIGEKNLVGPGKSLQQLIRARFVGIERIFDPMVAGPVLQKYSNSLRLKAIAANLQQPEFKDCSAAARAYDLAAQAGNESQMKLHGPAVDTHCLRSLARWRRADGEFRQDPAPVLLEATATSGLAALAVLERQTVAGEIVYVCGGLLRPNNRVLTAAHCFGERPAHRSALKDGLMRVRLARDPLRASWPIKSLDRLWRNPEPVQSDMVELEIVSDQAIAAPLSEFVALQEHSQPVVLGYFPHFDTGRQIEGDTHPLSKFPAWFVGLRWSRPGLCHAINAADRCARLLCQTINGYSGSPIFDQSAYVPGQPLRVLGLVSRPDHSQAACGAFLEYSTLAYTEIRQTNFLDPSVGQKPSGSPSSHALAQRNHTPLE